MSVHAYMFYMSNSDIILSYTIATRVPPPCCRYIMLQKRKVVNLCILANCAIYTSRNTRSASNLGISMHVFTVPNFHLLLFISSIPPTWRRGVLLSSVKSHTSSILKSRYQTSEECTS